MSRCACAAPGGRQGVEGCGGDEASPSTLLRLFKRVVERLDAGREAVRVVDAGLALSSHGARVWPPHVLFGNFYPRVVAEKGRHSISVVVGAVSILERDRRRCATIAAGFYHGLIEAYRRAANPNVKTLFEVTMAQVFDDARRLLCSGRLLLSERAALAKILEAIIDASRGTRLGEELRKPACDWRKPLNP